MTMSGVAFTETMRAHLAPGHDAAGKPIKNWDLDALAGAGAIRSTGNDMLHYLKANMGLEPSPLLAAMSSAQEPRRDALTKSRIGLAWMTSPKGIVWHNGATGGYRSFLGFTADRARGVVVLANTAVAIDDLGFATLNDEARLQTGFKVVTLPDASLDDYVGTYKLRDQFMIRIFRTPDGLAAQGTGQEAVPIFASAPNEFFSRAPMLKATFSRDAAGTVTGFMLRQNGDHFAPKLAASDIPAERQKIAVDGAALADYIGQYQLESGPMLDVTMKDGRLKAQLTGSLPFRSLPTLPMRFSTRWWMRNCISSVPRAVSRRSCCIKAAATSAARGRRRRTRQSFPRF